ncbi:zinc finger protein 737-like isoform X2 [Rhineura floridana]|uniref:zinc finger protein 737-like isoform X2 n=1 Tax=Rhineura floridana TaxID=261503 RepID=UPI002AC837D9|nr:zinc finger protein 737-like isoform X2 [Rhineura floridana]
MEEDNPSCPLGAGLEETEESPLADVQERENRGERYGTPGDGMEAEVEEENLGHQYEPMRQEGNETGQRRHQSVPGLLGIFLEQEQRAEECLAADLRIHKGKKQNQCSKSGESSGNAAEFPADITWHPCLACGKLFSCITGLRLHQIVHAQAGYQCEECGVNFNCQSSLTAHRKGHTGGKPYRCLVCGKTFMLSSNQTVHQRTCGEEKTPVKV